MKYIRSNKNYMKILENYQEINLDQDTIILIARVVVLGVQAGGRHLSQLLGPG